MNKTARFFEKIDIYKKYEIISHIATTNKLSEKATTFFLLLEDNNDNLVDFIHDTKLKESVKQLMRDHGFNPDD